MSLSPEQLRDMAEKATECAQMIEDLRGDFERMIGDLIALQKEGVSYPSLHARVEALRVLLYE